MSPVWGWHSAIEEWSYLHWCKELGLDPESLDAILAYEDMFDPDDQYDY